MSLKNLPSKGFTLIELLIVVAIIAILALIAVPNFMVAQTRSKVSRVYADLSTLATALEAYAVDYNAYPPVDNHLTKPFAERLVPVTTPIAYISGLPSDPFTKKADTYGGVGSPIDPQGNTYFYNTANNSLGTGSSSGFGPNRWSWSLSSPGPNQELNWPYYACGDTFARNGRYVIFVYDPTNGAISDGDIFTRGGAINRHLPGVDNR